jgi:hypothetical protein
MAAPFRISTPDERVQSVARSDEGQFKFYLDRLLKMIPGEVVGLYLVGSGFIPDKARAVVVVWAAVCLLGVIVVRIYGTADPKQGKPPQWGAVLISSVAFVIWIYTIGGPFAAYNLAVPYIGSLLVLAWTFFVPLFYKGSIED